MNNFLKIILALIFIVVVGVACFFLGRKVESDSISNNANKITVTENNTNEDNNVESNNSIEDEEFTDLITDVVNTNE